MDFRLAGCASELGDSFVEHFQVEVDPDGVHVAVLLRAEEVAGPAQLEVESRQSKSRAEI